MRRLQIDPPFRPTATMLLKTQSESRYLISYPS